MPICCKPPAARKKTVRESGTRTVFLFGLRAGAAPQSEAPRIFLRSESLRSVVVEKSTTRIARLMAV